MAKPILCKKKKKIKMSSVISVKIDAIKGIIARIIRMHTVAVKQNDARPIC